LNGAPTKQALRSLGWSLPPYQQRRAAANTYRPVVKSVTEAGVEPAKSPRVTALPVCVLGRFQVAGPGVAPGDSGL